MALKHGPQAWPQVATSETVKTVKTVKTVVKTVKFIQICWKSMVSEEFQAVLEPFWAQPEVDLVGSLRVF
jgi:hypothetical protein